MEVDEIHPSLVQPVLKSESDNSATVTYSDIPSGARSSRKAVGCDQ